MNQSIKTAALAGILGLTLLPFTNCGQYAEEKSDSLASLSVNCDSDCITPNPDNLQLKVNLGGNTDYSVLSSQIDFNLGGECNEGGYPYNSVRWELKNNNGVTVRNSGMAGMDAGANVNRVCINGKFHLFVSLKSIPSDPVDRTGLKTGSGTTRAPYTLEIEVYGLDSANDPNPKRNSVKGRARVSLSPSVAI